MQRFKKERGWRIGDRLDSWDGPIIYKAIWLPSFNYFQVWTRKLKGVYAMMYNVIICIESKALVSRIYKDEN